MNASYNNLRPVNVLLVEDSPTDLLMTREALEHSKVQLQLHVVEDGEKTMEFLRQTGKYAQSPRPDLILLDLNLPRKDGREVLEEIKSDPRLKVIPVIVLTTSKADVDVAAAYRSHANCFITKPVGFANFNEVMRSIERYWFSVATLPP